MALLVMNFIPDHNKAIVEMRRVTRPQGVVSACVWDYNAGMEMLRFFWDEVIALDPAMAPKDERNMKLSREGQLGELWKKTGLVNVQEKPLVIEQGYDRSTTIGDRFEREPAGGGTSCPLLTNAAVSSRRACESACREPGRRCVCPQSASLVRRGEVPKAL